LVFGEYCSSSERAPTKRARPDLPKRFFLHTGVCYFLTPAPFDRVLAGQMLLQRPTHGPIEHEDAVIEESL
jgi:hypothetical protein